MGCMLNASFYDKFINNQHKHQQSSISLSFGNPIGKEEW